MGRDTKNKREIDFSESFPRSQARPLSLPLSTMGEPKSFDDLYDGPEAQAIFSKSKLRWRLALNRAQKSVSLPRSSLDLGRCLGHIPSLPDIIPNNIDFIEGFSTWTDLERPCNFKTKTEIIKKIYLSSEQPTSVLLSSSSNFQIWDTDANNGLSLLVLGWSYILSAALAERQHVSLHYCETARSSSGLSASAILDLCYPSPKERRWWSAIISPGISWLRSDERISPWAIDVCDVGIQIHMTERECSSTPPSAEEAASYLSRFCDAYRLGSQSTAALAATLTIPLHADISCPARIELPAPSFATPALNPDATSTLADFKIIGYLLTLSLCPWAIGPALWSVFFNAGVSCNFAGACVLPIAMIPRPIIDEDQMETLAKIFSATSVAPLWLGLAICGRQTIIKCIYPSLYKLYDYPFFRPDIDAAAWTATTQSFLDIPQVKACYNGVMSRADVWRLRHHFSHAYSEENGFSHTPLHGWQPFGEMRETDVQLEIRGHLACSHKWVYSHWTWSLNSVKDIGFLVKVGAIRRPSPAKLLKGPLPPPPPGICAPQKPVSK